MKKCSKCGVEKPIEEFNKDKTRIDGHSYVCKGCNAKKGKSYYARNTERERERRKARYERDRDRELAVNRAWREANLERAREMSRNWYDENTDRHLATGREWRKTNPEQARMIDRRRRARERDAIVPGFGEPDTEVLVRFYGKHCVFPGCERTDATLDHIVALANGGKHTYENAQPLCASHNSAKNHYHHTDYRLTTNQGNGKEGVILTNIIRL